MSTYNISEIRDMKKYSQILELVRESNPLVHQITNYVTVNDCANMTICFGAAPVMSHAPKDVIDLDNIASALVLNIGTLDENQIEGMLAAGETAAKRNIPIILDPVGAGATPYRTQTAERFIQIMVNLCRLQPSSIHQAKKHLLESWQEVCGGWIQAMPHGFSIQRFHMILTQSDSSFRYFWAMPRTVLRSQSHWVLVLKKTPCIEYLRTN